jgi:hypothetical protein
MFRKPLIRRGPNFRGKANHSVIGFVSEIDLDLSKSLKIAFPINLPIGIVNRMEIEPVRFTPSL